MSDPALPQLPSPPGSGFMPNTADGLALLLWAADPADPARLVTPLHHAAAAAAMELPVEVYCSAASVRLLVPGVAQALRPSPTLGRSVWDAMCDAASHGVRFYACGDALALYRIDRASLLPLCSGLGGAVQFMARAGDLRWRALVF